ncbi:ABC transporter ATP-binding protein [Nocardia sp. CNY236]|uniref:ABC transporter ATP-binding protein n=1 Tax=Nocardia sp. CNY236 TaxID=1169152 RepID=UPI0006885419|nr:ABC transporter ATP-binding protein [Nocardia sp. CNY236]
MTTVALDGVGVRFGELDALREVGIDIPDRGMFALVGPNGAGKSTLLSVVCGLLRPTSGQVRLEIAPSALSYCPDVAQFDSWLNPAELLQLSAALRGESVTSTRIADTLDQVGLDPANTRRVGGFSRGMKTRLSIAAGILSEPRLLVVDEPVAALDPAGRVQVLDLLADVADQTTVLLSSHDLQDVEERANALAVLRRGRVVYHGPLDGLTGPHATTQWRIRCSSDCDSARDVLVAQNWVGAVTTVGPRELRVHLDEKVVADAGWRLGAVLGSARIPFTSLHQETGTLQDAFLRLTA